jgi:hypothetical protein
MLVIGVILIGIAFVALFSGELGGFIVLLIVGTILMLIWPLFMKLRGISKSSHVGRSIATPPAMLFVRVGGPIPNGGNVGWLVMWGVTMILLAINVITPVQPYFLGSMNFLDLALQASISSLLSYPGTADLTTLAPWLPLVVSFGGAFVAGLIARKPSKGVAAAAVIYIFTTIFLFFFGILFLAFEIDLNPVWAFIVAQLTARWAGGIGLLVSLPPLLLFGALGGLMNRKKD